MVTWQSNALDTLNDLTRTHNLTPAEVTSLKGRIDYWASALGPSRSVTKSFGEGNVSAEVTAQADVVLTFDVQ